MKRNYAVAAVLLAAIACTTVHARTPADVNGERIVNADKEPGNWMSHGRTYDEQRFSPLGKVHAGNVDKLGLAWTHKLDIDRGVEATAIVVDGVMYTTGAASIVYALDARTGKLLWKYDPKIAIEAMGQGCCDIINRGVAVWKGKVYLGAFDGRLIALDARTGKVAWEVDTVLDHKKSYTISGAPRIVKGKVLIGNGGAEYGVRGYVTAYDADSGKQAWRFFTVPGDPKDPAENKAMEIALKTWHGNNWVKWGGGGTAWDSMAYDPELNQLYIGVGNGSPWNYNFRSEGKGDNLFLSSIVAINPDNGEYIWHYQTTPGDRWDYTATQHMILADLDIKGRKRKVIMQAPKNGFFYVIDRATGELLSAEKFVPINWATHVDMATGRPVLTPDADYLDGKGAKVILPSFLGAHSWQPMSFNPKTGYVYLPAQESVAQLEAQKEPLFIPHKSVVNIGVEVPDLPEDTKIVKQIRSAWKGRLIAWDPVAQKAAWTQEYESAWNGGTLSTAGNLVFQGTADGRAVAYAADTGKKLWEAKVNSGAMAAPVTYEVNGEQYVTFMVGWGGVFPLLTGALSYKVQADARVVTFKLGASGKLPPPKLIAASLPPLQPLNAAPEQLKTARTMFNGFCASCHGLNAASGGVLPDLRYMTSKTHGMFAAIVSGARINRGMPAFSSILKPEDMELIRQYVIKRSHDLDAELKQPAP
ncbi:PQQ-dependent dehydrogenase, methanol/ethanol family [Ramlibacter sp. WS9]|uniref:PQQ-dependent dehydrogenase, methanol/ethanol family n=1 Tax=Ramlibacter sp. WS9 TaxID=1882741 RepID=UPI001142A5DC|nr:PQQ-dependent dehydrogenase, methanol/ethanol family [Ramlibacter sp. WS9]ROZ71309.1 PQQ-dependent dehydrogenase, methanol/ethanol family [Ramlibacter sp. WS9]